MKGGRGRAEWDTVRMMDEQHQEVPDHIIGVNTGLAARRCDRDGFKGRL